MAAASLPGAWLPGRCLARHLQNLCGRKSPAGCAFLPQHSEAASSCAGTAKLKSSPRGKNRSSLSTTRAATCFELRLPGGTQPCRLIPERGTAEGAEQACHHGSWPSRGFGSVLIGNSRCCSETGEKSPHEAF